MDATLKPVLTVGATGRIGSGVVDLLLEAEVPVRAVTRNRDSADLPGNVEVVEGDLAAPASLEKALQGVDTVFLVWTAPPATIPEAIDLLAAHAQRVVYLSAPHQTPHPFFQQPNPMAAMHAEVEQRIAASGLASTILRPGMLASNSLSWWSAAIRNEGVVRWPYGAAETAPIDDRDLAAVAAQTLLHHEHEGRDYVLTGPEALSQAEQVGIIAEVLGRQVRFEELTPEEFRRETAGVWPDAVVEMLLAAWGATIGHPAYITTTVADVLGRPPRTFRQWAADHAM